MRPICPRCQKRQVEQIEDWQSTLCEYCADREYERDRERREFEHYHPRVREFER